MARRGTETELPDHPTFEQAARAAVAEHSREATDDDVDETEVDDTDGDDDEHADGDDGGDESTQDDEGDEGDEDAEGDEDHGDDEAEGEEDDDEEPGRGTRRATSEDGKPGEFLSDKEWKALQRQHPNDPVALRKALEAAYTKKTQALSREQQKLERADRYADVLEAFETDPEATLLALVDEYDLRDKIATARAGARTKTGKTDAADEVAEDTAEQITARLLEGFKTEIGPEFDYLGDPLGKAVLKLVREATKGIVSEETAALKRGVESSIKERGDAATAATMEALAKRHPDWKDHEDEMFALSLKMPPGPGMTEDEWLDNLYYLVTRPQTEEQTEERVVTRVQKTVARQRERAAQSREDRIAETPARRVRGGPPAGRLPTFQESAAAALRGERWED